MKKLLILLTAAVLVTGFAFAQSNDDDIDGQRSGESNAGRTNTGRTNSTGTNPGALSIERFNAEINIGFPIHWTNGHNDDDNAEDKTVTANTSIGVGITFNFTDKIGLILEGDFFYGAELTGISDPTSDYISLSGGNIFLGPLFYLFNNNVFRIPLAAGFHVYTFSDSLWIPNLSSDSEGKWIARETWQLGIGVSLGFQFHFETGVYLFSRTNVLLDFIRISSFSSNAGKQEEFPDGHLWVLSWNVKPAVGIGIRF